jgi:hypothetical protein
MIFEPCGGLSLDLLDLCCPVLVVASCTPDLRQIGMVQKRHNTVRRGFLAFVPIHVQHLALLVRKKEENSGAGYEFIDSSTMRD